ncbi:MAG TPA: hypothetical protein VGN78_04290 [Solirubrobacteraceae bacterium]|nr:hypothetical protein [Solirubrobacteraceae bacterium]
MARRLIIATAVAGLALAAPAWAASPLDEYQQTGHITPCRYSAGQLQGSVPNDVAQYAPEYASQLQAAARERTSGCGTASGSSGAGTTSGASAGHAAGSGSAATAAGGAARPAVAAAAARRARARAGARRLARARVHLAAATVSPIQMSSDARVPDGALWLAALPILLLLALTAAIRGRHAIGRVTGRHGGLAVVNGNGAAGDHAAAPAAAAEAPTKEAVALYPPATSRRRKTR